MAKELSFGEKIRALRTEKQMTLRKFAETIGKSATFVSKIERDEPCKPSEETIRLMAKVLEANVDELIFLSGKMPKDLPQIIKKSPVEMTAILRRVGGMSAKEREALLKRITKDDKGGG